MGVEFRKDRNKWGFRIYLRGKLLKKRYAWQNRDDAERALAEAQHEVQQIKSLPPTSLQAAASTYLLWLAEKRSKHRYNGVRYNLAKWIIPYFGPDTNVTNITSDQIESFLAFHVKRVSLMTAWHYIKDLNALLNWCIRKKLLVENPVRNADRSELRYRVRRKLPLNPEYVEKGESALSGVHRAYYNFLRFTGSRRDEGNSLKWEHLDLDRGLVLLPGTKTPGAMDVHPMPMQLVKELLELPRTSEYVFPAGHGGKAFDRRKIFAKVSAYLSETYNKPIKLTPKDLRDWFGTQVVARTSDPRRIMDLMRHTNLRTTTVYMRRVDDELRGIVESLGSERGGT
jgi:integrase